MSPASAKKSALRQYVETFFEGSLAQMVTALVRHESWTKEELKALRAEIDRVNKEGRLMMDLLVGSIVTKATIVALACLVATRPESQREPLIARRLSLPSRSSWASSSSRKAGQ